MLYVSCLDGCLSASADLLLDRIIAVHKDVGTGNLLCVNLFVFSRIQFLARFGSDSPSNDTADAVTRCIIVVLNAEAVVAHLDMRRYPLQRRKFPSAKGALHHG